MKKKKNSERNSAAITKASKATFLFFLCSTLSWALIGPAFTVGTVQRVTPKSVTVKTKTQTRILPRSKFPKNLKLYKGKEVLVELDGLYDNMDTKPIDPKSVILPYPKKKPKKKKARRASSALFESMPK